LAAFLQFPERLNWKIMENGKRPLLISANVPDSELRPAAIETGIPIQCGQREPSLAMELES
jgi:hypothetical protein